MIPFLIAIAVAYWLAAPDGATAGARTAAGAGVRAAGSGARRHWADGRDSRRLGRSGRRDRWGGRVKGAKEHPWLLRAEHGAVTFAKAVAGTGRLLGAAAKPVPGAVRDGWTKGRDRHRMRAQDRPGGLTLDPPWWQPKPAPEQWPGQWHEQPPTSAVCSRCGRRASQDEVLGYYYAAGDVRLCHSCVQWLDRRYPDGWPDDPAHVTEFGQGQRWPSTTVSPPIDPGTGRPVRVPGTVPEQVRVQAAGTGEGQAEDPPGVWGDDSDEWMRRNPVLAWQVVPSEYTEQDTPSTTATRTPFFPDAPDGPTLDSEDEIRARNPELAWIQPEPLTIGQRRFRHLRDRGYPGAIDQDGWPAPDFHTGVLINCMPYLDRPVVAQPGEAGVAPLNGAPDGPDTDPVAGTGPAATPITEGAPMPTSAANVPSVELNDLDSLKRFAEYISSLGEDSEFMQIVERCKSLRESLREGGFGGHVDQAGASFEETAAALGQLGTEFCEEAGQMAQLAANVAGG